MIRTVVLKSFKRFQGSTIELSPGLNILVGDNLRRDKEWRCRNVPTDRSVHVVHRVCRDVV